MSRVEIIIPTFRRPSGLERALFHITALTTSAAVSVLVAENDPEGGAGAATVARIAAAGYRFPIRSIIVCERGLSNVRNALLGAALEDPAVQFVALLDDDEWPAPDWLDALLAMQAATDADAVGGTVLPVFREEPPAWAAQLDLFRQERLDGAVDMLWGTSNALFSRRLLERLDPPRFDPAFALTGGEDVDFFYKAKATGAVFAWASNSLVYEDIPQSRVRLEWIARRSFRIGNSNARSQLRWRYRRLGAARVLAKALTRLAVAASVALRDAALLRREVNGLVLAARSCGEIAALAGYSYHEYSSAR